MSIRALVRNYVFYRKKSSLKAKYSILQLKKEKVYKKIQLKKIKKHFFFIEINTFLQSTRSAVFSVKSTYLFHVVQCTKVMSVYLKGYQSTK